MAKTLIRVGVMFGMFALCVLTNIIAGVYYHVKCIGQCWNSAQFAANVLRMPAIGISTAILAVAATVAPLVLSHPGLMDQDFSKLVSVTLIVGMYVRAIVKYFKEALAAVNNILENRNIVEELQDVHKKDPQPGDKTVDQTGKK